MGILRECNDIFCKTILNYIHGNANFVNEYTENTKVSTDYYGKTEVEFQERGKD